MKPIKITAANADAINGAIAAVEGRATARTCDYSDCLRAVQLAEAHPALQLLPKKMHVGAGATYEQAVNLPNAYKYSPEATTLRVERRASGWYLVAIHRGYCRRNQNEEAHMTLTAAQSEEAIARFRAGYSVQPTA